VDCDFPSTGTTASAGDRECDALSGFDGPTGVGTPNGLTAFKKPAAAVSSPIASGPPVADPIAKPTPTS
jgi:hypothetical protein